MPSDRGTLRKLGEALLNATLMLIALVLLLAVVLVVQLRGLSSDLRADLAGLQDSSAQIRVQAQAALTALEQAQSNRASALPDEIARAREGLSAALAERNASAPPSEAGTLPRRMALAAVMAAVREYQAAHQHNAIGD